MFQADWKSLIQAGDAEGLALCAAHVLGVSVPEEAFLHECRGYRTPGDDWSDQTWWTWLKNRANRIGAYPPGCANTCLEEVTSCRLHVGFVSVVETDEHLARLRRNELASVNGRPTRSRITDQLIDINPVDRVAIRVAPKDNHHQERKH